MNNKIIALIILSTISGASSSATADSQAAIENIISECLSTEADVEDNTIFNPNSSEIFSAKMATHTIFSSLADALNSNGIDGTHLNKDHQYSLFTENETHCDNTSGQISTVEQSFKCKLEIALAESASETNFLSEQPLTSKEMARLFSSYYSGDSRINSADTLPLNTWSEGIKKVFLKSSTPEKQCVLHLSTDATFTEDDLLSGITRAMEKNNLQLAQFESGRDRMEDADGDVGSGLTIYSNGGRLNDDDQTDEQYKTVEVVTYFAEKNESTQSYAGLNEQFKGTSLISAKFISTILKSKGVEVGSFFSDLSNDLRLAATITIEVEIN